MTKIWERLFIGGLADAEELATGNPFIITTVISLCELPVENKRRRAGARASVRRHN